MKIFLLFIGLFASEAFATEHWILIHGTFAARSHWYKPYSDEYAALTQTLNHKNSLSKIHSFRWSGNHSHEARCKAADDLIHLIEQLHHIGIKTNNPATFHLIAHSHGATVVLLAAEKIFTEKKSLRFKECFALGMPVYEEWYPNSNKQIDTLYNFFSYGDAIQRVGIIFQRTLSEATNIHNIQLKFDTMSPGHLELYKPLFIKQLPLLSEKITAQGPYHMQINGKKNPEYVISIDTTRIKDLAADEAFAHQLISILGDSRKKTVQWATK